jgi:O-antigen/teichoic acid export membrane protein
VQQILSWIIFLITVGVFITGAIEPKVGREGAFVLLALGFSFPLASLKTIPSVLLERKLEFSKLVFPQIVEQLVYNGLLIYFAMQGQGVNSYTTAVLARSAIGVVVMYAIQRWPIGIALDRIALKEMIGMGVKFQLNDFLARIKDQLFYLVLGFFLPLKEFGYISFAKQWSTMPYQLTVQNVIAITFPTYSRLQHDKGLLKKAIEKTLFFISLLIFPMLVAMCILIVPLTQLVTKYQKWQPALLTFALFTLSIGWSAISTPLTNTLSAIGKINQTLKLMVMWTVLTWVLTPVGIYFFGFNGVAAAALAISFTSVVPIFYVKKIVDIQVIDQVWRQLFASAIMGGVGLLLLPLMNTSFLYAGTGAVLMGIIYVVVLAAIGFKKLHTEFQSLRSKKAEIPSTNIPAV